MPLSAAVADCEAWVGRCKQCLPGRASACHWLIGLEPMLRPPRLKDVPTPRAIFEELKSLATRPRGHRILSSKVLLGLTRVQEVMPSEDSPGEVFLEAARAYLNEAVMRTEPYENRIVAEVMLGLGEAQWQIKTWREEPAPVRQKMAGQLFRGDEGKVGNSTMRQLYQDPALRAFADVLLFDEKEARGEPTDNAA
jgi:hypothetical protein